MQKAADGKAARLIEKWTFRYLLSYLLIMSNLGHYSPYKRSYQFIHLQNSAYHLKNKQNVRSIVRTNLKHPDSSRSHSKNKTSSVAHRYSSPQGIYTERHKPLTKSFLGAFNQPQRIIHRDEIVQRAQSARISRQNFKIVQRLIGTECMVTDKTSAEVFYSSQKKYRSLRRRYQQSGERIITPIVNIKLLNPTLASFRASQHNQSRADIDKNLDEIQ